MALTNVERYWVSEFHPGEPVNECKPAYLEMVEAADYDELRTTLARALHLLWIGMEVGLDPVEKDEATALFVKYGDGEAFTGSLAEIIGDERPAVPASVALTDAIAADVLDAMDVMEKCPACAAAYTAAVRKRQRPSDQPSAAPASASPNKCPDCGCVLGWHDFDCPRNPNLRNAVQTCDVCKGRRVIVVEESDYPCPKCGAADTTSLQQTDSPDDGKHAGRSPRT